MPRLQRGLVPAEKRKLSPQSQQTFPYERYEIPETTNFPARVHGKVFFTAGNSWWVCSATVVTTSGLSAVFTAGHCVYSQEHGWAGNWLFVPGYRDGNEPFGEYAAQELFSLAGWANYGYLSYDIGVALVSWPVEGDVGARGIAFNQPRGQQFTSWGYPAANPFDGERLFVCVSNYWLPDPYPPPSGPAPMGIGCDMTGGSSGGGWTVGNQFVNSLNSFNYPNWDSEVMFGPYFGEAAENLYNFVCCGPTPQRSLAVSRTGSGSGTLTSSPPGINCGTTCSAQFNYGDSVTLSAAPAVGSNFAGWSGACSGTSTCTLRMDADKSATATFNLTGGGSEEGGGGSGGGGGGEGGGGTQSTSPPNTAITKSVINVAKHRAKFSFTASGGAGALSFLCKLDRKASSPCTSPKTYRHLKPGKHIFTVKAMDSRGQVDATPAVRKFNLSRQP